MYYLLKDRTRLQQAIHKLSHCKAPGPDGIQNEILKTLPRELHDAIGSLFCLMYLTATTPDIAKRSTTVLIHKKGDAQLISNYRPIALANTIYKLWTSMLTDCLTTYAEAYDILSNSQEGFRKKRNTIRQLQNMVNALSDAKLTNKDIFLTNIDFSLAFNTISHDKLLQIMFDLGFPLEVIYVVRNLYSHATTRIKINAGYTEDIMIERGTIQGDTLSPLLFLIFMEPLLRWLHSGGRGYKYGCLEGTQSAQITTSSGAYADDLCLLTTAISDMVNQTEKVDAYTKWSGMKVNNAKCGTTGVLYKGASSGHHTHPYNKTTLETQMKRVKIGGQDVPFLHPDKDAYPYLGVELTATLN